jgi:WLM domain
MMDKEDVLIYILVGFIIIVCLKVYSESELWSLKCIVSSVDGERYCVRERLRLNEAADLLAQVSNKCKELVNYVVQKYPNDPNIRRLKVNFNPHRIQETLPTSELTAYSENKGEKLAFCLNKNKLNDNVLIDLNTLTFVAIHELSHLMTESVGHEKEFWKNFKFLLREAKEKGIYHPEDYKTKSKEYCGMQITDNPLYDLKT